MKIIAFSAPYLYPFSKNPLIKFKHPTPKERYNKNCLKDSMETSKKILIKLDEIKFELDCIKRHMADVDMALTDEDMETLRDAGNDLKTGKTKRLN